MKKVFMVLCITVLMVSCSPKQAKKSCEATCKDSAKTECTKNDTTKADTTKTVVAPVQ